MASYVRSTDLDNNFLTRDGEGLPAYSSEESPLTPEALTLANAAVAAAHHDHNDPDGLTAADVTQSLFDFISQTSDDSVAHLFSNFPNLIHPNTRNHNGKTALAAAVETGNIRMVEMLINMGADVDMWSVQGEYPNHKHYFNKRPLGLLGLRKRSMKKRREVPRSSEYGLGLYPEYQILRTPLMIAASKGYLPIVKLLMNPPCDADFTLCAPDGQVALRLAVDNGHREIVDFLPSIRTGGFRRFKHQHATSTYRIMLATEVARSIAKALFWHLPRAILYKFPKWVVKSLWEMSKYVVMVAIPKTAKATWGGVVKSARYVKDDLPQAISRRAGATARGIKRFGKAAAGGIIKFITKDIPRGVKVTAEFLWKLFTQYIPNAIKHIAKFLWKTVTVYIPKTLQLIAEFMWELIKFIGWFIKELVTSWFPEFCKEVLRGLKAFASGSWDLLKRGLMAIASLIHTIFEAIISFFRSISLKDIWDGFVQVLKWLFVEVPKGVWKGLAGVYKFIVRGIEKMFGWWGKAAVFLWHVLVYIVVYFPMKIGGAFVEYSKVLAKGVKEILVWFNPKR